jgi:hypothetical protein
LGDFEPAVSKGILLAPKFDCFLFRWQRQKQTRSKKNLRGKPSTKARIFLCGVFEIGRKRRALQMEQGREEVVAKEAAEKSELFDEQTKKNYN